MASIGTPGACAIAKWVGNSTSMTARIGGDRHRAIMREASRGDDYLRVGRKDARLVFALKPSLDFVASGGTGWFWVSAASRAAPRRPPSRKSPVPRSVSLLRRWSLIAAEPHYHPVALAIAMCSWNSTSIAARIGGDRHRAIRRAASRGDDYLRVGRKVARMWCRLSLRHRSV